MRSLFLDLGHSLKWPGAVGIVSEFQWTREIYAEFLREFYKDSNQKWNLTIVPSDWGRWDWSSNRNLQNRISFINKYADPYRDLLISIHGNAATRETVRGVTTIYMGGSNYARTEAELFSKIYSDETGVPIWQSGAFDDRGSRFGRIGMVRDTTPLALLIEAGFVTNKADISIPAEDAGRAIVKFINSL